MIPIIENNKKEISEVCKKYKVNALFAFGSATTDSYSPDTSDIDFAVLFDSKIPVIDMADYYFGLIEELEKLLKSRIDLVTLKSVKNSVFLKELEKTMIPLYAA